MVKYIILYVDGEKEEVIKDTMKLAEDYATNNKQWFSITFKED